MSYALLMKRSVYFGASTWTYPGWEGLVYQDVKSYGRRFRTDSLSEYVSSGFFDCVGIDSLFYGFPSEQKLQLFKRHLPSGFPCVVKVPRELTYSHFTKQFGPKGSNGGINPRFLDPFVAREALLKPFRESLGANEGVFILQFPPMRTQRGYLGDWLEHLDHFLGELDGQWPLGIEVRNPEILTPDYFSLLRDHGAAHVFQIWTGMPLPHEVMGRFPQSIECASFVACRALIRPGLSYRAAVEKFSPYAKLMAPDEGLRNSILTLVSRAVDLGLPVFTTVNNRLEGCAPITIRELKSALGEVVGP